MVKEDMAEVEVTEEDTEDRNNWRWEKPKELRWSMYNHSVIRLCKELRMRQIPQESKFNRRPE